MTILLAQRRALLAKIETTLGTDAQPTASENAILVADLSLAPLLAEQARRAQNLTHFASFERHIATPHAEVSFSIECAPAATAQQAPAWDPLLKACGCRASFGNNSLVYKPSSATAQTLSLHIYMHETRHILTACRGTFSLQLEPQEFPRLLFQFRGRYTTPQNQLFPTTDTDNFALPSLPSSTSLLSFTLGEQREQLSLGVERFQFNLNNSFPFSPRLNEESIDIVAREPDAAIVIRDPGTARQNLFSIAEVGQKIPLQFTLGTEAGKRMRFLFPKVQLQPPQYRENDGLQYLNLPLVCLPDAGDDEFELILN